MRSIVLFLGLSSIIVGCAVGTTGGDVAPRKDGGIISKGDGGSTTNNNPTNNDCSGTLCGSQCVDTTSDPSNCGGCGVACANTETCSAGQCTPGGGNNPTSNEPPQGSCSHSLCTSGSALTEGCDTQGCSTLICDPQYLADSYCCTTSWDSQCMQEVTAYCSPYSCQ